MKSFVFRTTTQIANKPEFTCSVSVYSVDNVLKNVRVINVVIASIEIQAHESGSPRRHRKYGITKSL